MKLESIQIKNLRSCKDVTVPISGYTSLVGPNGAGKSTVLCALNIFFREVQHGGTNFTQLTEEDFHQKNTREPITITLTFIDLNANAQADFATYYRGGKLIITAEAVFDPDTRRAGIKQYGERIAMPDFAEFFKKEGDNAKVPELKALYAEIKTRFPDLPTAATKEPMVEALRNYEREHSELCKPLRSDDEFYGFSKGATLLKNYIQWVYVPAVKDASTEQTESRNTALGQLLERTVRAKLRFTEKVDEIRDRAITEYEQLLQSNQSALHELSTTLQARLTNWAHPEATLRLEWFPDPRAVSVQAPSATIIAGEDRFEGELCRLGHGLQRSYLLALLQELANTDDPRGPRLLFGCEEPELYQHPPQARHLFQVFQALIENNTQVIVSTHSPLFVSGQMFEDVRLIRKDTQTKASIVSVVTFEQISARVAEVTGDRIIKPAGMRAKLHQALQSNLNEMFFTQRLIIVEGLEDIAYITSYLQLMNRWDDYRRLGCHMISADGKDRIIQPLAIANALGIPTFVVFDSDASEYGVIDLKKDPEGKKAARRPMHLRDNTAILKLAGIDKPDPFPSRTLYTERVVMWHSDIGGVVEEDIGTREWFEYKAAAEQELGQPGGLEKNALQIALRLTKAYEAGKRSTHLEQLCTRILNVATASPTPVEPEPPMHVLVVPEAEPPRPTIN